MRHRPLSHLLFRIARRLFVWYQDAAIAALKRRLKSCGDDVRIGRHVVIWSENCVALGDNVEINGLTHIFGAGGVTIGAGTLVSACCSISSVTHAIDDPARFRHPVTLQPVTIGRNVWIGTGAIILPGVTIGDDTVVGAGAVVTRDLPAGVVAMGCPARIVRQMVLDGDRGPNHLA